MAKDGRQALKGPVSTLPPFFPRRFATYCGGLSFAVRRRFLEKVQEIDSFLSGRNGLKYRSFVSSARRVSASPRCIPVVGSRCER